MVFILRHRRHAGGRKTIGLSLARFARPPAFARFIIVIGIAKVRILRQAEFRKKGASFYKLLRSLLDL